MEEAFHLNMPPIAVTVYLIGNNMPKRIPQNVKTRCLELFLSGMTAKAIAETATTEFEVEVKPSTIYAWANQYNWGETRAVARATSVEKIAESETQRYARLQEEHLNTYETLRRKANAELGTMNFERASDAAKALDLGIKGERNVMAGMINLQFVQEIMSVLVEEITDADTLTRIAVRLKALINLEAETSVKQ